MPMNTLAQYPSPGTVVWTAAYLIYRHRGIVSDRWCNGKPMVICNSPSRGVVEQTWDDFRAGQDPQVEGYLGELPYFEVLRRARSRLGTQYHLTEYNCDHFVNESHGIAVESGQLKATLAIVTLAGLLLTAAAR